MIDPPLISVVMPVYNGEAYVGEAIESVLAQTYAGFEFIIVDDGSTDRSPSILEHYRQADQRIRVLTRPHAGLAPTRNTGWQSARGKYIAWADADDVCLSRRLEQQLRFMEAQPDIDICGTWVKTTGAVEGAIWRFPTEDAVIRSQLLFSSVIANPSVMMHRTVFGTLGGYDASYAPAEDYHLWARAGRICRMANLRHVLIHYRVHQAQSTRRGQSLLQVNAARVRQDQLQLLGLTDNAADLAFHEIICNGPYEATDRFLSRAYGWLCQLQAANQVTHRYPEPAFSSVLGERWFLVCRASTRLGWHVWRRFHQSALGRQARLPIATRLRFGWLCLRRSD